GDDEVGAAAGLLDQRDVAGGQVAHGGHQGDALAFATGLGDGVAQLLGGGDGGQAENSCSGAGKVTALTAWTEALRAAWMLGWPSMKFFTKRGVRPVSDRPSMSCRTSTWPSVPGPAPMPITGMDTACVTSAARALGTHSSSSMAAPACSRAMASARSW